MLISIQVCYDCTYRYSRMKKRFVPVLLFVLPLLLASCEQTSSGSDGVYIHQGVLDLREYDFEKEGVVKLDGQWAFYWETFLDPSSAWDTIPEKRTFIMVPSSWNRAPEGKDTFSGIGYATYRLQILLPTDHDQLMLRYFDQSTSCRIFLDGQLILEQGKPGKSKDSTEPRFHTGIFPLPMVKENNTRGIHIHTLTVQVANFHHHSGGIWNKLYIGKPLQIIKRWQVGVFMEIFIAGILFMALIYHLLMFFLYRRSWININFSLLLLAMLVHIVFLNNRVILNLFPDFNFEIFNKCHYISSYGVSLFYVPFLYKLFPRDICKLLYQIALVVSIFIVSIILFSPLSFYSGSVKTLFGIFQLLLILYFVSYSIPRAIYYKRNGAWLVAIGSLIAFATGVNDILYSFEFIHTTAYLGGFGILVFILLQTLLITRGYAREKRQNESLSRELFHLNESLEKEVSNRTEEIEEQKTALEKQKQNLEEVNTELKQLNLFKQEFTEHVIHDLKSPLNAILGFSSLPPTEYNSYIIKNASERMLHMVMNLLDIQKLKEAKLLLEIERQPPRRMAEYALERLAFSLEQKSVSYSLEIPEDLSLKCDRDLIERVLINMIDNAIKYSHESGKIRIYAELLPGENLNLYIEDQGKGIPDELKEGIFGRFSESQINKEQHVRSTGLGLAFCKLAVEAHEGRISVDSTYGQGTTFGIHFPAGLL